MTQPLPTVYLLGDSISAGYAPGVAALLAGAAEVRLRPNNGRDSRHLLAHAAAWLGPERLAVIQFNCGLHDLKRGHATGEVAVPLDEYAANLRQLVPLLLEHAGAIVWARTTPVVDGQPNTSKGFDRFNRDVDAYNAAADAVMSELNVTSSDLHAAVVQVGAATCLSADGVHLTESGYAMLARTVSHNIRGCLP